MSRGSPEGGFSRCMFVDCFWLFGLRVSSAWCSFAAEVDNEQYVLSLISVLEPTEDAELTTRTVQTRTVSTAPLLDAASSIRRRNLIPQSSWSKNTAPGSPQRSCIFKPLDQSSASYAALLVQVPDLHSRVRMRDPGLVSARSCRAVHTAPCTV